MRQALAELAAPALPRGAVLDFQWTKGRKRVPIAAAILAARKLASYDAGTRVPATINAIVDAVRRAEEILRESTGTGRRGVRPNDVYGSIQERQYGR
jgi:hypothetical protein